MSIREIFKNAKRSSKYELRCPVCGGRNIYRTHSYEWLMPALYFCATCGYTGNMLIHIESTDDKVDRS